MTKTATSEDTYYARHREERLAYQRAYHAALLTSHPGFNAFEDAAKRARAKGLPVATGFERKQILRLYDIAHEFRAMGIDVEVNHRVGLSTPGSPGHRYVNLMLLLKEDHNAATRGEKLSKRLVKAFHNGERAEIHIPDSWAEIAPGEWRARTPTGHE